MSKFLRLSLLCLLAIGICQPQGTLAFDGAWDTGHNTTGAPGGPGGPPGGGPQGGGGDPITLKSGNFIWSRQDFLIPGLGVSLYITRYYNSLDRYNGPFGYGWHFDPFMQTIEVVKGDSPRVIVKRGDGIRLEYSENGDGTYTLLTMGWNHVLSKSGDSYLLQSPDGLAYTFDASGNLSSFKDKNDHEMTVGYDAQGRISSVADPAGRTLTFTYGLNGKVASIADFSGRTVTYAYDSNDNLVRMTDPLDQDTLYAYDGQHRLLSVTDPAGQVLIQNTFDSQGRVTEQDHTGGTLQFTYSGNTTTVKNRRNINFDVTLTDEGSPTRIAKSTELALDFVYDIGNRLIQFKNGVQVFSYQYESNGFLKKATSPEGKSTSYAYDTYGRLASATDPMLKTTSFEYDAKGNLSKTTDALNREFQYEYDTDGKLKKVIFPDGSTTEFSHDANGYLTEIKDTAGVDTFSTTFAYDSVGNVTAIARDGSTATNLAYDAVNQLTQVTDHAFSPPRIYDYGYDPSGHIALMVEDGLEKSFDYQNNRLSQITYPDGSSVAYTYTANDLVTQATYASGTLSYDYDDFDRVIQVTTPDTTQFGFGYTDDAMTQITGPGLSLQLAFDKDRRLTQITDANTGKVVSFTYDDAGNRTQMIRTLDASTYTTTYSYDDLHRLTQYVENGGNPEPVSPPVAKRKPATLNDILAAYNFNQNQRLISLISYRGSGDIISQYSFEYPEVRFWTKTIMANQRWHSQVAEDWFENRPRITVKSPFELIR